MLWNAHFLYCQFMKKTRLHISNIYLFLCMLTVLYWENCELHAYLLVLCVFYRIFVLYKMAVIFMLVNYLGEYIKPKLC